jgi:hypothetical protein
MIKGNLVLKDFDIEREAGGAEKPIEKKFNATVTQNTLKIQFYWAGKGTTGIPTRGVYGPLISAISVDPSKSHLRFLVWHVFDSIVINSLRQKIFLNVTLIIRLSEYMYYSNEN